MGAAVIAAHFVDLDEQQPMIAVRINDHALFVAGLVRVAHFGATRKMVPNPALPGRAITDRPVGPKTLASVVFTIYHIGAFAGSGLS